MYQDNKAQTLTAIEDALGEIHESSLALAKMLKKFSKQSPKDDALEIIVAVGLITGYLIVVRQQLMLYKKCNISGSPLAEKYLNELKIQLDGLKSISYSYNTIYNSISEHENL